MSSGLFPYALVGLMVMSALVAITALSTGGRQSVSRTRLRSLNSAAQASALSDASGRLTAVIEHRIGGQSGALAQKMNIAQIKRPPQEFVLLAGVLSLVLAALLAVVMGPFGVVLGLALGLGGSYAYIELAISRTRKKFGDQLDENLQVLAGSLRAGYSLMQALASLAGPDGDAPARDEFARIINQTRIGRSVSDALDETAVRMKSEDFGWVAQAIAINREVGGNLANVLDGVAHTIRERGALRRQVASLSAEGKMSAIILCALPFALALIISVMNPGFMLAFVTKGIIGYGLLAGAFLQLTIGILVMRKMIQIKF